MESMVDQNKIISILNKSDLFTHLKESDLVYLSECMTRAAFKPGQFVYRQGDPGEPHLYVLAEGSAEKVIRDETGTESVIGVLKTHSVFGLSTLYHTHNYPASVQAKEHISCLVIHEKILDQLSSGNHRFSKSMHAYMADTIRRLYRKIISEHTVDSLRRMESLLFKKKVGDVMSSPLVTCRIDDPVKKAAALMSEKDVSALVVIDRDGFPRGFLTEKEMVRQLIVTGSYPVLDCRVRNIMTPIPDVVSPHVFAGQALIHMHRKNIKHLVVSLDSSLLGMITAGDLVKTKNTSAMLLTQDIESQPEHIDLRYLSQEINGILESLVSENTDVSDIFSVMSELHDKLMKRVVYLAKKELGIKNTAGLPVRYVILIFGSEARGEEVLLKTPDHVIIYEEPDVTIHQQVQDYFNKFSENIHSGLRECGLSRYGTENPHIRSSRVYRVSDWKNLMESHWVSTDRSVFDHIFILSDFRLIGGDAGLENQIRDMMVNLFKTSMISGFKKNLKTHEFRLPVSKLGTFITEKSGENKNEMNLKRNATDPIVSCVRFLSVMNRIQEVSTLDRIQALRNRNKITSGDAQILQTSFLTLMFFRIRENIYKFQKSEIPDDCIDPYSLRKKEKIRLMDALNGVSHVNEILKPWQHGIKQSDYRSSF